MQKHTPSFYHKKYDMHNIFFDIIFIMDDKKDKKKIGDLGESLACDYLLKNNYGLIEKNYFSRFGEIDIIAFDKSSLDIIFIEVKTRKNNFFGQPSEYVNQKKQIKIKKTALDFISKKNILDKNFRFDIIEVILDKNLNKKTINHIKNAFEF